MLAIFVKRILLAIPVIIAVASITFFLIKLAPGGPFDSEKPPSPEVLKNLKEAYNLDASNWEQYVEYMSKLVQGDLGPSYTHVGRPVTEVIAGGLPVTFELALYAILIALSLGIFSGVLAALKRNTLFDFIPMSIAMIGICVPTFLMGPLLVLIFGINLQILPVSGWGDIPGDKILPSLTLGFAYAAYIARLSRGGMLEVLNQDFIRTARAKGLTERMVVIKHAMQGGLIPVVAFLGPAIAGLLAGSFVVETVFNIPGIGQMYVKAALNRDYTMILGTTIFFSSMIVLFNLLSDLLALWLNPRSRDES